MGTAIRQWTHKLVRLANVKGRTTSLCLLGSAGMSGVVKKTVWYEMDRSLALYD